MFHGGITEVYLKFIDVGKNRSLKTFDIDSIPEKSNREGG